MTRRAALLLTLGLVLSALSVLLTGEIPFGHLRENLQEGRETWNDLRRLLEAPVRTLQTPARLFFEFSWKYAVAPGGSLALSLALLRLLSRGFRATGGPSAQNLSRPLRIFRLLLLSQESRNLVDIASRDLVLDIREMRRRRLRPFAIRCIVAWRTVGIVVPIVWDGAVRVVSKAFPMLAKAFLLFKLFR